MWLKFSHSMTIIFHIYGRSLSSFLLRKTLICWRQTTRPATPPGPVGSQPRSQMPSSWEDAPPGPRWNCPHSGSKGDSRYQPSRWRCVVRGLAGRSLYHEERVSLTFKTMVQCFGEPYVFQGLNQMNETKAILDWGRLAVSSCFHSLW